MRDRTAFDEDLALLVGGELLVVYSRGNMPYIFKAFRSLRCGNAATEAILTFILIQERYKTYSDLKDNRDNYT